MRKDVYSQHAYNAWSTLASLKGMIRHNNHPEMRLTSNEEEKFSESEMFAMIDAVMDEIKALRDTALAKEE